MAFEYSDEKKQTGTNVTLQIPEAEDTPVTNVSFSEEAETSEVQFNTSYAQDIAVTGVTYSGSFETAGRNDDLESLWSEDREDNLRMPKYLSQITFVQENGTNYTFSNVLITSHSKDAPADDRVTQSFDFSAEKMYTDG